MSDLGFSFSSSSLQNVQLVSKPDICSLHVQSDIKYRYAHTKVCSKVSNTASLAQEITFGMTLPENAFISSFSIEIDGKMYDAYVKEKEEAKQVYSMAVQLGKTAAHVSMRYCK
ncbi:Inter-alpha-trypsin inhibitor heavy chain H4 [Blattella germanica]|nr:Inter-alpha-trypsin inhibitor heavy chain H4 [Blattella germanica]